MPADKGYLKNRRMITFVPQKLGEHTYHVRVDTGKHGAAGSIAVKLTSQKRPTTTAIPLVRGLPRIL